MCPLDSYQVHVHNQRSSFCELALSDKLFWWQYKCRPCGRRHTGFAFSMAKLTRTFDCHRQDIRNMAVHEKKDNFLNFEKNKK